MSEYDSDDSASQSQADTTSSSLDVGATILSSTDLSHSSSEVDPLALNQGLSQPHHFMPYTSTHAHSGHFQATNTSSSAGIQHHSHHFGHGAALGTTPYPGSGGPSSPSSLDFKPAHLSDWYSGHVVPSSPMMSFGYEHKHVSAALPTPPSSGHSPLGHHVPPHHIPPYPTHSSHHHPAAAAAHVPHPHSHSHHHHHHHIPLLPSSYTTS
eukprot:TRINITY_DN7196_c0_g1_i1.p1 TRINITY_DN7196_c0_g1~~TRINITY_DN7196_c0_g1_i1.p1  ORF type:complete len:210 (+),score=61.89 TRINITY_DN7196_c0_g1_i1:183-812(+)